MHYPKKRDSFLIARHPQRTVRMRVDQLVETVSISAGYSALALVVGLAAFWLFVA